MEFLDKVFNEDCLEGIKKLPDQSVDCCITSPPYYGLRDYGTGKWIGGSPECKHFRTTKSGGERSRIEAGHYTQYDMGIGVADAIYKTICPLCGAVREDKQIGLEESPDEYVQKLVNLFHEIRRVLKDDGTLWVNIGDSYNSNSGVVSQPSNSPKQMPNKGSFDGAIYKHKSTNCKQKDLFGIPWLLAFSLRDDGWYLRQDIIWHKPAPMPESVSDRCTKSHEYIFLLSKKPKYYFDNVAIQEPIETPDKDGRTFRNKRDVWSVCPQPDMEAHFATYPPKLIKPCVLAGCRPGGVVLDPFMGSGTTAKVAIECNRHFVGFELNPKYMEFIEQKIQTTGDLFY